MWEITCGDCGEKSRADLWIETLIKGKLPDGHFQCPICKVAIRKVVKDYKIVDVNGSDFFIPERVVLEKIPSYL